MGLAFYSLTHVRQRLVIMHLCNLVTVGEFFAKYLMGFELLILVLFEFKPFVLVYFMHSVFAYLDWFCSDHTQILVMENTTDGRRLNQWSLSMFSTICYMYSISLIYMRRVIFSICMLLPGVIAAL